MEVLAASNFNLRAYRPECFISMNCGMRGGGWGRNLPMNPLDAPSKYQEGRKGVLVWLLRLMVNIFPLLSPEMFFTVNSFADNG